MKTRSKSIVLMHDNLGDNLIISLTNRSPDDWHGEYYPNGYKDPKTGDILINDPDGGYQEKIYNFDPHEVYKRVGPEHVFHIEGQTFLAKNIHHFEGE